MDFAKNKILVLFLIIAINLVFGFDVFAQPTTVTGVYDLLWNIADWFFAFIIIIAVIFILVSAYLFLTSQGSDKNIQKAKDTLFWSIIGLVVAIISLTIVNVVQNILGVNVPQNNTE